MTDDSLPRSSETVETHLQDKRSPRFSQIFHYEVDDYFQQVNKGQRAYAMAVYLVVARHATDRADAFPSYTTLCELTGLSRKTISESLKELKRVGLIEVKRRTSKAGRSTNLYQLVSSPRKLTPSSPHELEEDTVVKKTNEYSLRSYSAESESADSLPPDNKVVSPGQYGITELMDRCKKHESDPAFIEPSEKEKGSLGAVFAKVYQKTDGEDVDRMLKALDFMVAKAAGEIENEPQAWCGFGTAYRAVLDGWKPKGGSSGRRRMSEEEAAAWQEEQEQMLRELYKGTEYEV